MANVKVKISTEAIHDGERVGVGSVYEVTEEVYELNRSWMTPTTEPVNKVAPAAEKAGKKNEEK